MQAQRRADPIFNGMFLIRDIRGFTEGVDQVGQNVTSAASEFQLPGDGRCIQGEYPEGIAASVTNETVETLIIDITVNEDGQIFVTQRGIPNYSA